MFLDGRQALALSDQVVVQLRVEPASLGRLGQRIHRAGAIPIDQRDGVAIASDDVPWRHVAVADDTLGTAQSPPEP